MGEGTAHSATLLEPPIYLVIDKPISEKNLAAIRLFANALLNEDYTAAALGDVIIAMPPTNRESPWDSTDQGVK